MPSGSAGNRLNQPANHRLNSPSNPDVRPRGTISLWQTLIKEALGPGRNGLPLRISSGDLRRWMAENRFWGRKPEPEFLEHPWLNYDLVRWVEEFRPATVLEWGSGSSTLWFARLPARVISVEHDPGWHAKVLRELDRRGLAATVRLIPAQEGYVGAARTDFSASFPDLILIDGNWRAECLRESLDWIRRGAKAIFHDAQAEEHRPALNSLPPDLKKVESYGPCHGMKNFRGWALIESR